MQVCVTGVPENGVGVGTRIEILFEDILAELFKFDEHYKPTPPSHSKSNSGLLLDSGRNEMFLRDIKRN